MHVESWQTKDELAAMIRGEKDARVATRLRAVLLALKGRTHREISDDLAVSPRSVQSWVERYNASGAKGGVDALRDRPRPGQPKSEMPPSTRSSLRYRVSGLEQGGQRRWQGSGSARSRSSTNCGRPCSGPGPRVNNVVPIVLTTAPEAGSDEIGGMIVPVTFDGHSASLAIDTGSSLTFLYTGRDSAPYTPNAGRVTIGHESFVLPGRNFEAEDETGAHIVGVLGAEFLLDTTTEFDPRRMIITRYESGSVPDTRGWVRVPMEDVDGHIILTLTIDGRDRRLMWDTGSPHLLLIGEGARPGDTESLAQDVAGGRFPIYSGFAALQVAGAPENRRSTASNTTTTSASRPLRAWTVPT